MRTRRSGRRPVQIAVIGGDPCTRRTAAAARAVGRALAEAGAIVICGGRGGVMAAVAHGAAERGGTVVGLLPSYRRATGNPWLTIAIPTGLDHARNVLVAASGDALIALPGAHGTRTEIAFAIILKRPVVALDAWQTVEGVTHAKTPSDAVRRALTLARRR